MTRSEIEIGGFYKARISGKIVTVKVTNIRTGTKYYRNNTSTTIPLYDVLNTATGRSTVFRSAAKFRGRALSPAEIEERNRKDAALRAEITALLARCPAEWGGSVAERLSRLDLAEPGSVPPHILAPVRARIPAPISDDPRPVPEAEPEREPDLYEYGNPVG